METIYIHVEFWHDVIIPALYHVSYMEHICYSNLHSSCASLWSIHWRRSYSQTTACMQGIYPWFLLITVQKKNIIQENHPYPKDHS